MAAQKFDALFGGSGGEPTKNEPAADQTGEKVDLDAILADSLAPE